MNLHTLALLVLALGMAGCGKTEPTKSEEPKPGEKKDSTPPTPTPGVTETPGSGTPTPPAPLGPTPLAPNDPSQQQAAKFIADLSNAADMAELLKRVSPGFLKAIGKPLLTDADKKLGYSESAASAWLRRAGLQLVGMGPPTGYGSPAAAVFVGSFGNGSGRFLIRMVFAEGWKVDWFSMGTILAPILKPTTTEGPYQDFAVLAFLDSLTGNAASKEDRVLLLGGLLSTKLKTAWAEPFQQDKDRGYDFSASLLGKKPDEFGTGATGFSRTPEAGDTFKIELAKGESKTTYTLKLVKGAVPGEWLVEEFSKQ